MKVSSFRFQVLGLMSKVLGVSLIALLAGCATQEVAEKAEVKAEAKPEVKAEVKENYGAKNVAVAKFMDVPESCENLLKTNPDDWNFSFRPYGNNSQMLWTDPIVKRAAVSGEQAEDGKHVTGLNVTCNADGWTFLVFIATPEIEKSLMATNGLPVPSMEFFFCPGDTDNHRAESHYHFYCGEGFFAHYPWSVQDRTWRNMVKAVRQETRRVSNGYVLRFTFPWEQLFDKLPFTEKDDNFWRLQVCVWVDGGITFGGVAHQVSRAGYVKFPNFTDEQKAEIMDRLLQKGLYKFLNLKSSAVYSYAGGWGSPAPRSEKFFVEHNEKFPRTWINYGDDPAFQPVLKQIVDERLALEPQIAKFRALPPAEQLAFYRKASDMLFNFRYDVEDAYAKFLTDKIVK